MKSMTFFLILLVSPFCFSGPLSALPDEEVQKLVKSNPDFARAETTLLDNWKLLPKATRSKIREQQLKWIATERDKEAAAFMSQGFSFVQAYTLCTAARNNMLVNLMPANQRKKAVTFNVEATAAAYSKQRSASGQAQNQADRLKKQSQEDHDRERRIRQEEFERQERIRLEDEAREERIRQEDEARAAKIKQEDEDRKARIKREEELRLEKAQTARIRADKFLNSPVDPTDPEFVLQAASAYALNAPGTMAIIKTLSPEELRALSIVFRNYQYNARMKENEDEIRPLAALINDLAGTQSYGASVSGRFGASVPDVEDENGRKLFLFYPDKLDEVLAVNIGRDAVDYRSPGWDGPVTIHCQENDLHDCTVLKVSAGS